MKLAAKPEAPSGKSPHKPEGLQIINKFSRTSWLVFFILHGEFTP
jgi:hypothetical protein